jgi:hypothetical protein
LQQGNVGDFEKHAAQLTKENQTILPFRVVFDHHHHVAEKTIDRLAQRSQLAQHFDVVTLLDQGSDRRGRRLHRVLKAGFHTRVEQGCIDLACDSATGLAQDIADTLVRGGECLGLGKARKLDHGAQATIEIEQ